MPALAYPKYYRENNFKSYYTAEVGLIFTERALQLLKHGGCLAFITPDTFLNLGFTGALRTFLLQQSVLQEIVVLPAGVFVAATVDTCLLFAVKAERKSGGHGASVRVKLFDKGELLTPSLQPARHFVASASEWAAAGVFAVKSNSAELALVSLLEARNSKLSEFGTMFSGIKAYEVGKGIPPQTERIRDTKPYTSSTKIDGSWHPFFDGKNIGRFKVLWKNDNWIKYGAWLAAPRDPEQFRGQKILIRKIVERRLVATYIAGISYCNTLLFILKLHAGDENHYKSLLGILNSSLIGWFYNRKFQIGADDTFPQIMARDILQFPVPRIECWKDHKMITLVDRILAAKKADPAADTGALEREIDQLVYQLYGLMPDEIKIVEGGLRA